MTTYQEDDRDVEEECNEGVAKEREGTDTPNIGHGHARQLAEQADDAVHDGASGSVVVQRNEGVHLELGGAEQALDHDQANCLKGDTTGLVEETRHVELDFAKRGNDDTNDDKGNIAEGAHVGGRDTERPGGQEDGDGGGGLSGGQKIALSTVEQRDPP